MSLFFGDTEVENNSILYPNITSQQPKYDAPFNGPITVLLLNSGKNKLYWFNYNGIDVIPYTPPTDLGRYAFMIFDSTNVILPRTISENDFTKNHKITEFTNDGSGMIKIIFNVNKNPLEKLPGDVPRFIFQYKDTKIGDLLDLCESDPALDAKICKNPYFYKELARQRLTANEELINGLSDKQIYELIDIFETEDTKVLLSIAYNDATIKIEELIKYETGLTKLLTNGIINPKYFYYIAAKGNTVKSLKLIYEIVDDDTKRLIITEGFHGMPEPYRTKYITDYLNKKESELRFEEYNVLIQRMIDALIGEVDEDDNISDYPEERREVLQIILNLSNKSEDEKARYRQEFYNVNGIVLPLQ